MATVFDNPYIKQLGLLPMEQTQPAQPLEGILGQRGLVSFGLNMLANPNGNFGQQFAQGLGGAIGAVDAYNQQLNKNAQQAAEYNLKVGQLAANYDLTDRELDIKEQAASAGAPLQQLLMAQMFGIKPTVAPIMNEPIIEPSGIIPDAAPQVNGGILDPNLDTTSDISFGNENVNGGYIDNQEQIVIPANPMLVPPVNTDIQQGKDIIKMGGVMGSAPLVSAGESLLETGVTERDTAKNLNLVSGSLTEVENALGNLSNEDLSPLQASSIMRMAGQQIGTGGQDKRDVYQGAVAKLAAQLTPLIRPAGSGAWTDSDQERLERMLPDLSKSKAVNQQLIDNIRTSYNLSGGVKNAPKSVSKIRKFNPETGKIE